MGFLLKPDFLKTAKSAADVQKLMKADLKNNAGHSGVKFVAAKNYDIGGKKISLFIVTDQQAQFEAVLKTQASALKAKGICDLEKDTANNKIKVTVKSSSGQMLGDGIAKIIPEAVAKDPGFVAENFKGTAVNPNAAKALEMAKASHAEARLATTDKLGKTVAPKLDHPEFKPDAASVEQMAKVALETAEYKKFADAYEKLALKYKFNTDANYKKVPVNIWHDLIKSMTDSGYITKNIPKVGGDPYKLIFASKEPGGKMIREELLARAMTGMNLYIQHAAANLDKVVKAVTANGGKAWSFWSGEGAKAAALKEAGDGVVLEGSIGSWYDEVWRFEHLTGVNDMLLWNSMSELYARKAAEYYKQFKFKGFIGPGGSRDTTVYVNIERPTMIQVLNVEKQVAVPPFQWFVVDCEPDPSSRSGWKATGKPSKEFPTRQAAVAEVVARYKA